MMTKSRGFNMLVQFGWWTIHNFLFVRNYVFYR